MNFAQIFHSGIYPTAIKIAKIIKKKQIFYFDFALNS